MVAYALSRRPNVKLVDTGLPFGKEGFTSHRGKKFDSSMRLTRRYYPHTYNVDGFFVAKFKKIGPTPPKAVGVKGSVSASKNGVDSEAGNADEEEIVDKTPIGAEEGAANGEDDFGGFDDEEDAAYIEKAKRNAMRRRGLDPQALNKPKGKGKPKEREEKKEASKK